MPAGSQAMDAAQYVCVKTTNDVHKMAAPLRCHLFLALLAAGNNLESSWESRSLAARLRLGALFGHLVPATGITSLGGNVNRRLLHHASLGELLAANELHGELLAVHCLRVSVDDFSDDIDVQGHLHKTLDEFVHCKTC